MPKFRKKSSVVEAEQWYPGLLVSGVVQPNPTSLNQFPPHVLTPVGAVELESGDWIVEEDKRIFVYRSGAFEQTYEPADSEAQIAWTQAYGFNSDPIHALEPDNRSDEYVVNQLKKLGDRYFRE